MPQTFELDERLAGIVSQPAKEGDRVEIISREMLTSLDGAVLTWHLEALHQALFSRIPNLLSPSQIDHLLVVIAPDLSATAYVNELSPVASVRLGRAVEAGEAIRLADVLEMTSYDLGIEIPTDSAVVVVRSHGWRRALFFDFGPLHPNAVPRAYDLGAILAQQTLALIAGKFEVRPPIAAMQQAIAELETLLRERSEEESRYQILLERYPWFLGGQHVRIDRHTSLDDTNIPDFTGIRARDGARDIFEIKQPFLKCFRKDGGFSADFNAAYQQAERYLTFVRNNKEYLRSEKVLVFANPHCFLLIGSELSETERRRFHDRESHNPSITVLTYEQLASLAKALLAVVTRAGEETVAGAG